MEIKIDINTLKQNGLFLATPMYGGQCAGMFARSIADLSAFCAMHQIPFQMYFLFNESLIPRARNYCVDEFMRGNAKHFLFIDADIGFNPQDIIAMMALQANDENYHIIGGPYPKKTIAWEKIKHAVDKGVADEDPSNLENFVGDFVFNPKAGNNSIKIDEPVEVLEIGTGFMMVTRAALEKFADEYKQYSYKPDHVRTEHFDGSREITMFFQSEIDPKTKRYLSEDYWFCQKAQDIGLKTWLCPWMKLQHVGTYIFGGSLADLASVGAAATADPSQLKKKKKA
jgi:glycosyltransferase involved in cell wall biosynthesis